MCGIRGLGQVVGLGLGHISFGLERQVVRGAGDSEITV
jgi:hypothetical protein